MNSMDLEETTLLTPTIVTKGLGAPFFNMRIIPLNGPYEDSQLGEIT
jgi:hypothetical protein